MTYQFHTGFPYTKRRTGEEQGLLIPEGIELYAQNGTAIIRNCRRSAKSQLRRQN